MIFRMLTALKGVYEDEIKQYMADRYVDAGRATPMTAERFAQVEFDYASDDDIIEVLEELGYLSTAEF